MPLGYEITNSVVFRDNKIRITIKTKRGLIEFFDDVTSLKCQFAACVSTRINLVEMPTIRITLPMSVIEYIHYNILSPIPYERCNR